MEEQNLSKKELYDSQKEAKKKQEAGSQNRKHLKRGALWFFVFVVLGGSVWGLSKIAKPQPENPNQQSGAEIAAVALPSDWITGNKESKIVLIEYSDFQCPACGAYYPLVKKLIADQGGSFQFVYRHFPLSQHANAKPAAYAAEAAGRQGKFWEMEDMIFTNQTVWSNSNSKNASDTFLGYARSLNLNIEQFKKDRDSSETKEKVNKDYQSGIKAGVNSTPTFFLNGKKVQPASYDEFSNLIKQAQDSDPK